MNSVSMNIRNVQSLVRKAAENDLGYRVCAARDIPGPGGGVFIAANTELTARHLAWLEQRNPARRSSPTFVDVVFIQHSATPELAAELETTSEESQTKRERQERATEISREVVARGEDVVHEANAIFKVIGDAPLTAAALRSEGVQDSLAALGFHVQLFHRIVSRALEEYLSGNTLIMDLITEYQGPHTVRHGLNVAVFAAEMCSHFIRDLDGYFEPIGDAKGGQISNPPRFRDDGNLQDVEEAYRTELAEIFLCGFMHDCGLWNEAVARPEGHEKMGASLVAHAPDLSKFAPYLETAVLFHSEILRLASRSVLVRFVEHSSDPARKSPGYEMHRTVAEAEAAIASRGSQPEAELMNAADVRRILPVALSEYYITQTEGFDAKSRPEAVGNLVRYARGGLYEQYMLALCNSQVEMIAPRRAYVKLDGFVSTVLRSAGQGRRPDKVPMQGYEGVSISHSNDMYSPHVIVLYRTDEEGTRREVRYVAAQDPELWGHGVDPECRMYIPAGRFKKTLSMEVTGFMQESVYDKILGAYERNLKLQMM